MQHGEAVHDHGWQHCEMSARSSRSRTYTSASSPEALHGAAGALGASTEQAIRHRRESCLCRVNHWRPCVHTCVRYIAEHHFKPLCSAGTGDRPTKRHKGTSARSHGRVPLIIQEYRRSIRVDDTPRAVSRLFRASLVPEHHLVCGERTR